MIVSLIFNLKIHWLDVSKFFADQLSNDKFHAHRVLACLFAWSERKLLPTGEGCCGVGVCLSDC